MRFSEYNAEGGAKRSTRRKDVGGRSAGLHTRLFFAQRDGVGGFNALADYLQGVEAVWNAHVGRFDFVRIDLRAGLDTALPIDHAVAFRVDQRFLDAWRRPSPVDAANVGEVAGAVAIRARYALGQRGEHLHERVRMVVRFVDRRPHQDDLVNQGRVTPGEFARVDSTQAVTHDHQLALGLDAELGEDAAEAIARAARAIGVGEDAREVNLMTAGAQPVGERIQ